MWDGGIDRDAKMPPCAYLAPLGRIGAAAGTATAGDGLGAAGLFPTAIQGHAGVAVLKLAAALVGNVVVVAKVGV